MSPPDWPAPDWWMPGLLVVAAAVVAVVPARRRARRRVAVVARTAQSGPDRPGVLRYLADRPRLVAGLTGAATVAALGGWSGLLAGAVVAVLVDRGLPRLTSAGPGRREAAEAADLPLAADLLAVALRGGAPVDRAAAAVAEALPGPLAERLARVSRALALGATPAEAWAELDRVPGGARLGRAAVRSAERGSALAAELRHLADDLRADRVVAAEADARRAGVWIVLPLGLCFLPAFMLAGLVPVIVAVLSDVL